MDAADDAEPAIGDTHIDGDDVLLCWDGRQWLPYQRQVDTEGHIFRRHGEDPDDC
ncbi:hypothetical protein ABZ915_48545 [Streptomyces sp. NPDC046915]|uniref:hypothetical protein n=1 Tax=Streptomyces sp. NPDC046915 TaxID=3155257 RepID=UPI00340361FA